MSKLRYDMNQLSQGKRVRGVLVEIARGLATVKLGDSNRLLKGLKVMGGTMEVGQSIYVDYASGVPIVMSYSAETTPTVYSPKTKTSGIDADLIDDTDGTTADPNMQPHIDDATADLSSLANTLNTLLAELEAYGILDDTNE